MLSYFPSDLVFEIPNGIRDTVMIVENKEVLYCLFDIITLDHSS